MLNGLGTNTAAINAAASSMLVMASASFDAGAVTLFPEPNHVHLGSADIQSPTQAYFDIHGRMMAVMDLTVEGEILAVPNRTGAIQGDWQNGISFVAPLTEYLFGTANFSISGDQWANASAIYAEASGTVTSALVGVPTRTKHLVSEIDAKVMASLSGGEVILGSWVDMPVASTWVTEPHIVSDPQTYDGSVNWGPVGTWTFDNDHITIIANGMLFSVGAEMETVATKTNAALVESSVQVTTAMSVERTTQYSIDFVSDISSIDLVTTKYANEELSLSIQSTALPKPSLTHAGKAPLSISAETDADVLMLYGAKAQWDTGASVAGFVGDRIRTVTQELSVSGALTGEADVTKIYYFDFQAFGALLSASAILTLPDAPDERELVVPEQNRKLVVGAASRRFTA